MVGTIWFLAAGISCFAQAAAGAADDRCDNGASNAPIRIEVFSDFQCPACRAFYLETIRPVMKEYASTNKLCLVYHDFPLRMHSHAHEASRFSVAARKLGREQWLRVSEALYDDQLQWSQDGNLESSVARVLTADEMSRLKKYMADPAIDATIDQEIALAMQRDIRSTPTFFITANGREQRVVGGVSYPILKDYLDRLLK